MNSSNFLKAFHWERDFSSSSIFLVLDESVVTKWQYLCKQRITSMDEMWKVSVLTKHLSGLLLEGETDGTAVIAGL